MRIKSSIINGLFGFLYQVITIVLNFVSRKIFLDCLGLEYLGLNSLFTNILAILSLAEIGIGNAINYSLYKPLAENNIKEIQGLMNLYKVMYRWIAIIITLSGLIIMFFIQYFIKDISFNLEYIRMIYILFLINTVLSYFVAYKRTLIYADQKNYVIAKWDIIINVIGTIIKVISLIITRNYVIYLIIQIIFSMLPNIIASKLVNDRYPYIVKSKTKIEKERLLRIKKDIKNLSINKLSTVIVNSTDNIIISTFIGINTVGLISNYNTVINALNSSISQALSGVQASLGNLTASSERHKIIDIFRKLSFFTFWIASVSGVTLYMVIHDFVTIWLGEKFTLYNGAIEILIMNLLLMLLSRPMWQLVIVSGLFEKDKKNALIEMILNLLLSIIFVQIIGLNGVLLGTTISFLSAWILKTKIIYRDYLKASIRTYLKRELLYILIILFEIVFCMSIVRCLQINNLFIMFIVKVFFALLIPNIINFVIFRSTNEFKYFYNIANKLFIILKTKLLRG